MHETTVATCTSALVPLAFDTVAVSAPRLAIDAVVITVSDVDVPLRTVFVMLPAPESVSVTVLLLAGLVKFVPVNVKVVPELEQMS